MEKECSKCKQLKDINNFYKSKNRKDGLHSYCKECDSIYRKKLYDNITVEEKSEKECLNCKETKDIERFPKNYYSKDKKYAICVECIRKMMRVTTHCECGRDLKWLNYLQRHLQTKIHNKNINKLENS